VFSADDYPAVVPNADEMREVRRQGPANRRTAELERAIGADELDREGLTLMPRWRVDIIRKRAERLGIIEAANEKEAIEKAAKEFDIPPERQNRITVERMTKNKD
jgi:hypothetical protein